MSSLPRACVIGAGSSGIAGAKALHERGIPFDCFEKSDRVGGNWVFGNRNGMSSAYRTLHINTSRERMEYSDFPMPKSFPDFPRHDHIASYFDAYVEHFGFRDRIAFETGVAHADRREDGVWEVELDSGESRRYDALLVANGHHWDPRWPEPPFPGRFDGRQMHAHEYKDSEEFRDRRVVILGMGNSAMDLAVDSSYVARTTYLAARRGAYVIPKYIAGKPIDQPWRHGALSTLLARPGVPLRVRQKVMERTIEAQVGRPEEYGLPTPDHRIFEAHPTVSGRILDRIAHGTIVPKPNIAALEGDRVRFADGSAVEADVVVYCTGYKVSFPFFDEDLISAPDNDLPLFRRVFHPDVPNVFFLALLQPLGATMPLAEAQGQWIADYLRGEYHLPPPGELREDMRRERGAMFKRYVRSKRHTMQIDFDDYLHQLGRERRAGAVRARRAGYRLPVPAQAERGAVAA